VGVQRAGGHRLAGLCRQLQRQLGLAGRSEHRRHRNRDRHRQPAEGCRDHTGRCHRILVVRFAGNRAALSPAARRILTPARPLIAYASRVRVTGYCAANEPSRHHLLIKLSRHRAQTARRFLFSGDRRPRPTVKIVAAGATQFVAPNRTAAGRARNRRAVVVFTYPKPLA
jgi:outer membrane protein OmpA-like peptidoglycan-associated protein